MALAEQIPKETELNLGVGDNVANETPMSEMDDEPSVKEIAEALIEDNMLVFQRLSEL